MLKIAIGHKARVGKDTFYEIFSKTFPADNIKFADGLYKGTVALQKLYDLPVIKDRKLLQIIGEHFRENYSYDFWINQTMKKIEKSSNTNLIVTDVRYQNEFNKLKQTGFTMVKVNRPGLFISEEEAIHLSENDLNNETGWDYVVENDRGLEEYEQKVLDLVYTIINNKIRVG